MMMELEALKKAAPTGASSYRAPPPKVNAPSPNAVNGKQSPAKPTPRSLSSEVASQSDQRPAPVTEGAKLNRLRRLCEIKPSGRCHVPTEVHERWKKSTKEEKEAMIEELELANWDKDPWAAFPYELAFSNS